MCTDDRWDASLYAESRSGFVRVTMPTLKEKNAMMQKKLKQCQVSSSANLFFRIESTGM